MSVVPSASEEVTEILPSCPRDDGSRDEQAKSDAIRISAQAGGVPHQRLEGRVLKFRRDRHAAVVDLQHDIFGQAVRSCNVTALPTPC